MILGIETSLKRASISLIENGQDLGSYVFEEKLKVSESLVIEIGNLISRAGIKKSKVDLIAVSNGPGSLTGIRIGSSVGLGLGSALGIECIGISLADAMISDNLDERKIVLIPAGKNQSYFHYFGQKNWFKLINNETFVDVIDEFEGIKIIIENSLNSLFDINENRFEKIVCSGNLAGLIAFKGQKIFNSKIIGKTIQNLNPIYLETIKPF